MRRRYFLEIDLRIQSDLVDKIESIKNPNKVKHVLDRRLIEEFDPATDKVDRLILDQVEEKLKKPKIKEKQTLPKTNEKHP